MKIKIFKLFVLIFFIIFFGILISNKIYYPLNYKKLKIDTIFTKINDTNDINNLLIENKHLKEQIIVTTHPNISIFYKFSKIPIISDILKKYLYIDRSSLMDNHYYGGIILYDYNVPLAYKYGGTKVFINKIIENNTYKVLYIDTLKKIQILIKIKPIIFTDFDYSLKKRDIEYIRLKDLFSEKYINNDNNSSKVLQNYSEYGINSFLGPNVDFEKIDSNYTKKIDDLIKISIKCNQIICLKHFCYESRNGNTHKTISNNNKTISALEREDLMPYKYFAKTYNKKYLIMVGHHIIKNLDSKHIASKSIIIYDYIKNRFPKSITISDEITMKASSNNKGFENIKETTTDFILTHGGNIINYREDIFKYTEKINEKIIQKKINRILDLKKENNLVSKIILKY